MMGEVSLETELQSTVAGVVGGRSGRSRSLDRVRVAVSVVCDHCDR